MSAPLTRSIQAPSTTYRAIRRIRDISWRGYYNSSSTVHYANHTARGEHQAELDEAIAAWSRMLDADELLDVLDTTGVPGGRIYRAPEMLTDPQFIARNSIVGVDHPLFKNLKMQDVFPRMSRTQGTIRWTGPKLGEHNDDIYK